MDAVAHNRLRLTYLIFSLFIGTEWMRNAPPRAIGNVRDPLVGGSLLLILAGLGVRSWAAGVLHKNRDLATTGPYGLCRHPLYLGSFLILGGMSVLISENCWPSLLLFLPLLAIYALTIRREDDRLAKRLGGTWSAYAAQTPCLFPSFRRKRPLANWSLAVWRHNRETNTQLCVLLGLAGLAIWRAAATLAKPMST